MKKTIYIPPFRCDDFRFTGAYCFSNETRGNHFILGKNGCSIIINTALKKMLVEETPNLEFQFKLVQHGLADIYDKKAPEAPDFNTNNQCSNLKVSYFIIDTTKRCNFDCIYCFRDLSDNRDIDFSTLKDICCYIETAAAAQNTKNIHIQIWGGEPLLVMDRIQYIIDYFNHTEITAAIDIETNGSLINDQIARKLWDWGVNVGVSIDGTPRYQDIQRRLLSGRSSAASVKAGILALRKYYGSRFGGITVVTKYNNMYISDIVKYYVDELGMNQFKFNIVRDNPNAKEKELGLSLEEVGRFANNLCDVVELYHIMGVPLFEGNIQMRKENLLKRSSYSCCISNGCQGGRRIVSFDRKGDIYPCEMMDYPVEKIGSIYRDGRLNEGAALTAQMECAIEKNPFFVEKKSDVCTDCPWFYFCRGGCTSKMRYLGRVGEIDETECVLNRIIYSRIIKSILNKSSRQIK